MAHETSQERIDKARSEDMEAHTVGTDPMLLQVENRDSSGDGRYTVLPDQLYCGCWDHTSRGALCKHLLFLGLGEDESVPGDATQLVRSAITDGMMEREAKIQELQSQIRDLEAEIDAFQKARSAMSSNAVQVDDETAQLDEERADEFVQMMEELVDE